MDFHGHLARVIQTFLAADVNPGQCDDPHGSVGTLYDVQVSGLRYFSGKPDSKTAWLVDGVCSSCHKEPAKLSCPVLLLQAESFLRQNIAAPFAGVCFISFISPGV